MRSVDKLAERRKHPIAVHRRECAQPHARPSVLGWRADILDLLDQLLQKSMTGSEVLWRPSCSFRKYDVGDFPLTSSQSRQLASNFVRRQMRRRVTGVHSLNVSVQAVPTFGEALDQGVRMFAFRGAQLPRSVELTDNFALVGLIAV